MKAAGTHAGYCSGLWGKAFFPAVLNLQRAKDARSKKLAMRIEIGYFDLNIANFLSFQVADNLTIQSGLTSWNLS